MRKHVGYERGVGEIHSHRPRRVRRLKDNPLYMVLSVFAQNEKKHKPRHVTLDGGRAENIKALWF